MLKFALDSQRHIIPIGKALKGSSYFCIECGERLTPRISTKRAPHYAHISHSTCKKNGVSAPHLQTQYRIQSFFAHAPSFLETPFVDISRIADLCIPSQKLIFEVQCSSIGPSEVLKRTADYQSMGYRVIWILHTRRFPPNKPTDVQKAIPHLPHYYSSINDKGEGTIFDYIPVEQSQFLVDFSEHKRPQKIVLRRQHPLEKLRRDHWKLSFKGDWIHSIDQHLYRPLTPPKNFHSSSLIQRAFQFLIERSSY